MNIGSTYLHDAFINEVIDKAYEFLSEELKKKFFSQEIDGIIASGYSGMVMAPILSYKLGLKFGFLRKEEDKESTHSGRIFEGHLDIKNYIIVDDIYAGGGTIRRIVEGMKTNCPESEYRGCFFYSKSMYYPPPVAVWLANSKYFQTKILSMCKGEKFWFDGQKVTES